MSQKPWPKDCIWPKPEEDGCFLDVPEEDEVGTEQRNADPFIDDLLKIKEYADHLISIDVLDEEYVILNEEYFEEDGEEEEPPYGWEEYFEDDRFDLQYWQEAFADRYYKLKLYEFSTAYEIERIIGYEFVNQNLLRQAFTRKSFAVEYGLSGREGIGGSYEELEFLGDRILDLIVTKEIANQFTCVNNEETAAPFETDFSAGQFTEMKANYVCKEHLAGRAEQLGLDGFILYGTNDAPNINAKEDVMEALIGAVAADTNWNMEILSEVVDRLVGLQLDVPGRFLKKNFYDIFNNWHMRHFGALPEYSVYQSPKKNHMYFCQLRFHVPENDKEIQTTQYVETTEATRSMARGRAAEEAYTFLRKHGLWKELKDSGIEPDFEHCINQWQELFQKKYVEEAPVYEISEQSDGSWYCRFTCETVSGYGAAASKVKAKKKAAFMAMKNLYAEAGIRKKEWEELCNAAIRSLK